MPDWYTWRLQHWGTKWDLRGIENEKLTDGGAKLTLEKDNKSYSCEFDTAWHPPLIALESLSKQIPDLEIHLTYSDEMMNFTGIADIKDGDSQFIFEEPDFVECMTEKTD